MKIKYLLLSILILSIGVGCSSSQKRVPKIPVNELSQEQAQEVLSTRKYGGYKYQDIELLNLMTPPVTVVSGGITERRVIGIRRVDFRIVVKDGNGVLYTFTDSAFSEKKTGDFLKE